MEEAVSWRFLESNLFSSLYGSLQGPQHFFLLCSATSAQTSHTYFRMSNPATYHIYSKSSSHAADISALMAQHFSSLKSTCHRLVEIPNGIMTSLSPTVSDNYPHQSASQHGRNYVWRKLPYPRDNVDGVARGYFCMKLLYRRLSAGELARDVKIFMMVMPGCLRSASPLWERTNYKRLMTYFKWIKSIFEPGYCKLD